MGSGIAQVAAMAGYRTILYDVDAGMTEKDRAGIEKSLVILADKKKITAAEGQAVLERLSFAGDVRDCIADLIIEAIVEKPDIKLDLFLRLAAGNKRDDPCFQYFFSLAGRPCRKGPGTRTFCRHALF